MNRMFRDGDLTLEGAATLWFCIPAAMLLIQHVGG